MTFTELETMCGKVAYLNSGRPVKIHSVLRDSFGVWVTFDVIGTLDREVVEGKDIHATLPVYPSP